MARRGNQVPSTFQQVQKQARELVAGLRNEIRAMEMDLRRLKDEESQLARLAGRGDRVRAAPNGTARSGGGRVNWGTVLEQMPNNFRAADIGMVRSVKGKRSSEIFAGISRWVKAGEVKRKERGLYERVK
jgi:hypothetical protein